MTLPLYNIRFILLISASFITIFSSIAIYFCLPILISHVMRTQLSLAPTSGSFDGWRLNSVVDRFYLYNITNLDEILIYSNNINGGDIASTTATSSSSSLNNNNQPIQRPLPKLKQIGPFIYRQDREKLNIKFNKENETVLYDQSKRWTFLPELNSLKSPEELNSTWINHINIPLAGTTLSPEYAEFIDPIVLENDLKLFINHSVQVLLFDGYFDILMEGAKGSGQIDVDRFGWLYNQNNSVTKNIRVFTGPSNATLDKLGAIDQFNYKYQFDIWHNNNTEPNNVSNVQCNDYRFSSAGEFFPPPEQSIISHNNHQQKQDKLLDLNNKINLKLDISNVNEITENNNHHQHQSNNKGNNIRIERKEGTIRKSISLFMPDLCRTFRLFYNGTRDFKGLSVDRYIANEFTYDYTEEALMPAEEEEEEAIDLSSKSTRISNRCYCIYNEQTKLTSCPPNGMMDLFTCRKGSPLTISFPHFLYSVQDKTLAPYLNLFEDDYEPNESEHQFYIDLESTLNIPVNAQIVIQFNVHFRNELSLNFTRDYSFLFDNPRQPSLKNQDFYLPQMWFKSSVELDEQNLNRLKFIQKHLDLVTPITTILMFGLGSILLLMSAKLAYDLTYGPKSMRRKLSLRRNQESSSSLDQNELNSNYMEEKQKYYAMQLLGGENSTATTNNNHHHHHHTHEKPSTSKKMMVDEGEPLNR